MSFVDIHIEKRISKNPFFSHINKIIDWNTIEKELQIIYVLHVLEAIAHNLKRFPGLVYQRAKNEEK